MAVTLKGMTWSHPRGYEPLEACAAEWQRQTGIAISWDKRSLQDFESFPVEELARAYDLIIIDHPHIGQVVAEGCLLPLDMPRFAAQAKAMATRAVGQSYASYAWQGRQWALPVDTATQVQAHVPSRLARRCQSFNEVLTLAEEGRVALPLRPPHSLMCLYTLSAHLGTPCNTAAPPLITGAAAERPYALLQQLFKHVGPQALTQDPIAVFEEMASVNSRIACSPLIYGYVNYALDGFRPQRITFSDMPVIGGRPPNGSALGGTGLAVSARSAHADAAMDFAWWVASGDVQRGLYVRTGGQPGHADAWEDAAANAATLDFYKATRATLEGVFMRPRHKGYMGFQQEASDILNDCLVKARPATVLVESLNAAFARSFPTS